MPTWEEMKKKTQLISAPTTAPTTASKIPANVRINPASQVWSQPGAAKLVARNAANELGPGFLKGLSSAGATSTGKKLSDLTNRTTLKEDFGDIISNWREGKQRGVGVWQRLVNALGDTIDPVMKVAEKINPGLSLANEQADKLLTKRLNEEALKNGMTPDAYADKLIAQMMQGVEKDYSGYTQRKENIQEEAQGYSGAVQEAVNVSGAIGRMVPAIVIGLLTKSPNIGMGVMSAGAGGEAAGQAYQQTGDIDAAFKSGVLNAGAEFATEKMFGGIPGLGKGVVGTVGGKALSANASKALTTFLGTPAGKIVKQMALTAGEGTEEAIMQIIQPYITRTYDPTTANSTLAEIWSAAKTGGIASLIMRGAGGAVNAAANAQPMEQAQPTQPQATQPVGQTPQILQQPSDQLRSMAGFAVPEGGKQVPSELATNSMAKSAEAGTLPQDLVSLFSEKTHGQVGQQESIQAAQDSIVQAGNGDFAEGARRTYTHLIGKVSKGQALNSTETTAGLMLLQNYAKQGIAGQEQALQLGDSMIDAATEAGRILQIYKVMQQYLPGGMTKLAERTIENRLKNGIKTDQLTDQDLRDIQFLENIVNNGAFQLDGTEFNALSTDAKKWLIKLQSEQNKASERGNELDVSDASMGKVLSIIESKRKTSGREKFRGLQRIGMLSNPKTHVRNIVGNTLLRIGESVASPVSSLADKGLSKITGQRTYSGLGVHVKEQWSGLLDGLSEAVKNWRLGLPSDSKFIEETGKAGDLKGNLKGQTKSVKGAKKQAFNDKGIGKVGNAVDNFITFVLDLGDAPFLMAQYNNVLKDVMKGNPEAVLKNNGQPTAEMADTALESALRITFKDENLVVQTMQAIRNSVGVVGDIIAPFTKTPSNLVKLGLEYSPFGWAEAIYKTGKLKKHANAGESTMKLQRQISELWGRGSVGTILILIGMVAKSLGKATGQDDEELKKQKDWNLTQGLASNSILIDGKYYDLSSIPPLSVPFLAGAAISGKISIGEFLVAMSNVGSSIMDVPVLQGIKEMFSGSYQDEGALQMLIDLVADVPSQITPGISTSRQIANLTDTSQRDIRSDKSGIVGALEMGVNRWKAAIPGLRETLPEKYDLLGRKMENYPADTEAGRALNIFLNPANMTMPKNTAVIDEINKVYAATGDLATIPTVASNSVVYNNTTYKLTPEEQQEMRKVRGQVTDEILSELITTGVYRLASSERKADMLKSVYDAAGEYAKESYLSDSNILHAKNDKNIYRQAQNAKKAGISTKDFYSLHFRVSAIETPGGKEDTIINNKVDTILGMSISDKTKRYYIDLIDTSESRKWVKYADRYLSDN